MQKHNAYLCGDCRVKSSGNDVLLPTRFSAARCGEVQRQIPSHERCKLIDEGRALKKYVTLNDSPSCNTKEAYLYNRYIPKCLSNKTTLRHKQSFWAFINSPLFMVMLFIMSSAQLAAQSLADSDLNNQSLYASGYITAGARTTVGGNVQSATAVTLAANAIFAGNVEAGAATTLGADAGVVGYIEAGSTVTLGVAAIVNGFIQTGTTATVGASAIIDGSIVAGTTATFDTLVEVTGDVLAGTTVTVGAGSTFHGNVDAGTTTTIGAGVQIDGILTANSLLVPPPPLLVTNQEVLITTMQTALKDLGTGTELVSITFGVNNETLEAGIYSTIDYLTITGGKTLTLDGKGVDGTWIFNIANYLSFAIDAKVILLDVTDNSTIIWNVLGDKPGAAGYTQLGAGAETTGFILAKGFVQTGANTVIEGIANDCGGAYSATNFIEFGADSVIGQTGCTNGMAASITQAIADAPPEATIDFGDAPASYSSLAADNGASHSTENNTIFMGSGVDAEFDSYQFPLSDDVTDGNDDEDGVAFVTGLEVGNSAQLELTSSTPAFVDAWIDFDRNGVFGSDEKIADTQAVILGNNNIPYDVPEWAEAGTTWARFRLSSTGGLEPTGSFSDGEVEDHQVDITEADVSINYYPSASGWATIAFEDNWPSIGDYDFNDLVMNYRISEYRLNDEVIRIKLEGQVAAVGALHHNGFAFHLPGVLRSTVDNDAIRYTINDVPQNTSPLESGRNQAIAIITDDVWDFVSAGISCNFHRTEPGCGSDIQMGFSMTLPMAIAIPIAEMPEFPYDPFLFATDGYDHSLAFGLPPGREYEIHLPDKAPTEAFRVDFFGRREDRSEPENGRYFVSENGMPWAINVGVEMQYSLEYVDIIYAYPLFSSFIANQGLVDADWYTLENANTNNIFSN
ncbi:MAG: LruC domain-containing protein [Paraglaciecola sp.]|jgi:LruC domain-containing protein